MTTGSTLNELIEFLKHQVTDEDDATASYRAFAGVADRLGHHSVGATLRGIAEDEQKHSLLLRQIVKQLSWISESGPVELQRPFPQTYDDWADLGIDIGAKDPSIKDAVYRALTKIYEGTPDADEAKRWLVNKAGELGVT